jgi:hypothetical protein
MQFILCFKATNNYIIIILQVLYPVLSSAVLISSVFFLNVFLYFLYRKGGCRLVHWGKWGYLRQIRHGKEDKQQLSSLIPCNIQQEPPLGGGKARLIFTFSKSKQINILNLKKRKLKKFFYLFLLF